jgi:hypothetical protein
MEQLRKLTGKREYGCVYFTLFVLAVYAILMRHMKADCSLRRLFTRITLFFLLLPVWLFRHKGCTNYRKRDTRKEFIWIITKEIKPFCTGRIHVIDRWIGEIWWRAVNSRWGSNLYDALLFFLFAWLLICCSTFQLKSLYRYFGVGLSLSKWTLRFGVLSAFNVVNTLGKLALSACGFGFDLTRQNALVCWSSVHSRIKIPICIISHITN